MVGLVVLLPSAAGCFCMALIEFRRVELMTQRIRMPYESEWICGMFQAKGLGFAEKLSARSGP